MKKSILPEILRRLNDQYPCCQFGSIPIDSLLDREKDFFHSFMPDAVSALLVAHHIVTMEEWRWYQSSEGSEGHERCDADDHAFDLCRRIEEALKEEGFETMIVPYPHESGLQFRYVAQYSGIGQIGKSAFLIHPKWGP
ncbi:MAG: hypothetical protein SVM80_04300 [Halobacteriota archaeon]|nr:hypothetical protein [Halobacteriota archaeon]